MKNNMLKENHGPDIMPTHTHNIANFYSTELILCCLKLEWTDCYKNKYKS